MLGQRSLKRGQKRALERMDAECEITRTVEGPLNEETGLRENIDSPVYSGICRIKGSRSIADAKLAEAAGQLLVLTTPELHIPADKESLHPGDRVRITKCRSRPALIGRTYTVKGQTESTQVTALRYRVEAADAR